MHCRSLAAGAVPIVAAVGASYGKLDPGHEEACYDLKKDGCAGRVIREKLAAGYNDLDPVQISSSRANQVAKKLIEERDELYASNVQTRPAPEGLRLLTRRLLIIAERETLRMEKAEKAGKLDANKLGRLAGAMTKLHVLMERNEEPVPPSGTANNDDRPKAVPTGLAADILADVDTEPEPDGAPEPTGGAPAPIADVPVPAAHPPPSGQGEAVPSDPPSLTTVGSRDGEVGTSGGAVAVGAALPSA